MNENDYKFEQGTDAALNELMEILRKIPKNKITTLNMPQYKQALISIDKITKFIKKDCPDAEITVDFDELTETSLCLRIVAGELNVYKIDEFCKAIEPASTMNVIPRLDEKLEIGFTYEKVCIPAPPISN